MLIFYCYLVDVMKQEAPLQSSNTTVTISQVTAAADSLTLEPYTGIKGYNYKAIMLNRKMTNR